MPRPAAAISRAVLITGCSTGIGRATALRLVSRGWPVVATARRLQDIADLREAGCTTVAIDVTDDASMVSGVQAAREAKGVLGCLVNNAGYSQGGALETVSMVDARRQLETNVIGPMRMAQLLLPDMRAQGWGRIVNVGSMAGRLTLPGAGWYHASKYALESLSDAMRFEVAGFGVRVVLIEPGLIASGFAGTAAGGVSAPREDAYLAFNAHVAALTRSAYSGPVAGPERVARAIEQSLRARHPRARRVITVGAHMAIMARRLMPDVLWDLALRQLYPRPKSTSGSDY